MFIIMAVDTQQFPIAAVRRVVIMVMILMMDRELTKFFTSKFAPAPGTDLGEDLQRTFSIALFSLSLALPNLFDDPVSIACI